MKTISAAEFKATCLDVLDQVAETGRSFVVTKRGKPVAKLVPLASKSLKGSVKFIGDIISPVVDPDDWEANRD